MTLLQESSRSGLLSNTSFRHVWAGGAITSMVRWLDMLVLALFAHELNDGDVGAVAVALAVRMAPRFLFGLVVGALADRFDRRRLWVATLLTLSALYFGLAALVAFTEIQFWQVLAFAFVAGIFWSVEFPTRRAMIGDVVRPEQVNRAVGLDWSSDSILRIPGPLIGGGLLETAGAEWAYLFAAVVFAVAASVALHLRYEGTGRSRGPAGWGSMLQETASDIAAGVSYVRRQRLLVGALMVTLVFNLVFPVYNAALPEIGKTVLGVGEFRIGVLDALVGFGSFAGGLLIAGWSSWAQSGRIYYLGTAWFLLCATAVAFSETYLLTALVCFAMGFGFSAFAIMQTAILVRSTPMAMRGRVMGLLSFVIGLGPMTGFQVLLLSDAVELSYMVLIAVLEGAALMLATVVFWPSILSRLQSGERHIAAAFAPQRR